MKKSKSWLGRSTRCKENSRRRTKNSQILISEVVLSSSGSCSQGVLHFKRKNSSSLRTSAPYEHRDVFPKASTKFVNVALKLINEIISKSLLSTLYLNFSIRIFKSI